MDNDLEKYTLGEGVELIAVPAGRFKTNEISVSFATELHPQHAAANALALRVIASVSRSYPTPSALSRELAYLYGADLQPLIMKSGASQVLSLGLTCIDDRYSMDAQSIGAQAAALLCDLIFHPRLQEDGQFFKEDVDREKEQLIQQICAEENDKRVYAYHRLEEEMFRGEPCSVSRFGTAEQVAALTPADVREALTRLVETAKVVVTVVGSCGVGQIKDLFADAFSAVSRRYAAPPVVAAASAPEEPRFVTDRENVKQGKLVLGFRVDCAPDSAFTPAVRSAADVFGGGPYSKLFVHVREKMSLCYYCSARYVRAMRAVIVQCGCEEKNMEKAVKEILTQLAEVQKGNCESEFASSKAGIGDTLLSVYDTPQGLETWYLSQIADGDYKSPRTAAQENGAVTFEDVRRAAGLLKLDTVYRLVSAKEAE